jgi:hypothetical protein
MSLVLYDYKGQKSDIVDVSSFPCIIFQQCTDFLLEDMSSEIFGHMYVHSKSVTSRTIYSKAGVSGSTTSWRSTDASGTVVLAAKHFLSDPSSKNTWKKRIQPFLYPHSCRLLLTGVRDLWRRSNNVLSAERSFFQACLSDT